MILSTTTTLWRQYQKSGFSSKESRLLFGMRWEAFKGFWSNVAGGIGTGARAMRAITWPIHAPANYLIKKPLAYTWKALQFTVDKTRQGVYMVTETGKEAWRTVYRPGLTLAGTAVKDVWLNLYGNTRAVIEGVLNFPKNLWHAPGEFKNGVVDSVNSVRSSVGNALKSWASFSPRQIVSSHRKMLTSVLSAPFKPFVRAGKPFAKTPVKVIENIGRSKIQYITAIPKSAGQFRDGIRNVISAPRAGLAKSRDRQREIDKLRAEAREAEKEQKLTGEEAAAKERLKAVKATKPHTEATGHAHA